MSPKPKQSNGGEGKSVRGKGYDKALGLGAKDTVRLRRQKIMAVLKAVSSKPPTAKEVFDRMDDALCVHHRTIQRDLQDLECLGFVEKSGSGWKATSASYEEEVDRLISLTALGLFQQLMADAVPLYVQKDLRRVLKEAEKAMAVLPSESMTLRWLKALRLSRPYPYFLTPVIDPDVRSAVEDAIGRKQKLRIEMKVGPFGPWPPGAAVVSVSHFVMALPDRPTIVVWREDEPLEPWPDGTPRPYELPLESITSADVLEVPAFFPDGHEPTLGQPPVAERPRGADWIRFELRVDPLFEEYLIGKWIAVHWEPLGRDESGWLVCRVTVPDWPPKEWMGESDDFVSFLEQNAQYIEVLSPFDVREKMRRDAEEIVARYADAPTLPDDLKERLLTQAQDETIARALRRSAASTARDETD
jgi:hypothetical protein